MSELADESIQCVVTSPPYWGLRNYSGVPELEWGDGDCDHRWGLERILAKGHPGDKSTLVGPQTATLAKEANTQGVFCQLCGSWKGSYGLEPTIAMYIEHTIEILREIRRVLRPDGVVFWNIGDSYASGKGTCFNPGGGKGSFSGHGDRKDAGAYPLDRGNVSKLRESGLKPKDLCLIPFRVAIAAQDDGWWVRSIIIWNKSNPMPESVTDRPTTSHEYILMLTKSSKYYWDADAVRENSCRPGEVTTIGGKKGRNHITPEDDPNYRSGSEQLGREYIVGGRRNIRSVWSFPTQPYPEAHFAVFPEKLPETCIKAATPEEGCCSKCGAPYKRILDKKPSQFNIRVRDAKAGRATAEEGYKASDEEIANYTGNHPDPGSRKTVGWQPTFKCNAPKTQSIVLDCFAGAGTTLWVAKRLNRKAVGYELSPEYCDLVIKRVRQQALM